jgi:two-component system, LuxR family, response regulator FixJ
VAKTGELEAMGDGGPMIAVVDDDVRVQEALENLLSSVGFDIVLFSSAESFLDAKILPAVLCLITDVKMPGMSGVDLLKTIRSTNVDLPIIIISGHHDSTDSSIYLDLGANAFVAKPFDTRLLLETVNELTRA